jgi:hypothetical protein
MDLTVILLIIVLIIILYLFYTFFIASTSQVVSSVYLGKATTAQTITDNPTAANFSVGVWVYVNSWDNTHAKNIFYLSTTSGTSNTSRLVSLDIGTTAPTLTTTVGSTTIDITENLPLQKWVYIIVSVSSSIVDCYLDGRLVSSYQLPLTSVLNTTGAKSLSVSFATPNGGAYLSEDIYLYSFNRYSYPMDPSTAQSNYYWSSPPSTSSNNYSVSIELDKNGQTEKQIKLF